MQKESAELGAYLGWVGYHKIKRIYIMKEGRGGWSWSNSNLKRVYSFC